MGIEPEFKERLARTICLGRIHVLQFAFENPALGKNGWCPPIMKRAEDEDKKAASRPPLTFCIANCWFYIEKRLDKLLALGAGAVTKRTSFFLLVPRR